jgi:IS5 family transposase
MIQRRYGQRTLFEAVIGSLEQLVCGLVSPELERLDVVLADETLREVVVERLARRRPRSRTHGRPGTPAEVVLRMLVLKRLKGWTFEETEKEVRASLVYRHLVRVYFERVPDAKTLIRLSQVIGAEGVEAIHRQVVELAREAGVVRGRRARVDTTVVETNIHYPTDSSLLRDGVRVLLRAVQRVEAATTQTGARVRNRLRATTRRTLAIVRAARGRGERARLQLQQGYRQLLRLVRATVRDSEQVVREVTDGLRQAVDERAARLVGRLCAQLAVMLPRVRQVIKQAQARVFGGDTHFEGKLLSVFEPHTEAIRKGKAAKPTEFGKLVKLHEAENRIIVDYEVFPRRPADVTLLQPTVARHRHLFGRAPRLLAGDRGFWSAANKRAALEAGVKKVCVPATGRLSAAQRAEQHERWFRRGQRYRTGCEGRISVAKRRDGLARCRYRGPEGMRRWVGWGVISNNLWGLILAAKS